MRRWEFEKSERTAHGQSESATADLAEPNFGKLGNRLARQAQRQHRGQ